MAQTIGICKCDYMLYTPFSQIYSMIKSSDSKEESLFQKQIYDIKNYLSSIKEKSNNYFSFLGIDEIFSGTNYNDAEIASQFYIDQISKNSNQLSLITTHLKKITKKENIFLITE